MLRSEDSNMNGAEIVLKDRHMSSIAIGGAIGTGIFLSTHPALEAGPPISLLARYCLVGAALWFVVRCLGETAALFLMEYPILFIDGGWAKPRSRASQVLGLAHSCVHFLGGILRGKMVLVHD